MSSPPPTRQRPGDFGIRIGTLPPGPTDSIVDVANVRVGHQTVWRSASSFVRASRPVRPCSMEPARRSVLDSLFRADTVQGRDGHIVPGLPVDRTLELLRAAGRLPS